jgi:hypothetical protein
MRHWVIAVAVLAAISARADTHFRIAQMKRTDTPAGRGQCDIRLQVDDEVEVTVRRDVVLIHTLAGKDANDDGSECSFPLPDRDVRGFNFQSVDGRNEMRLVEPPSPRNDFAVIVRIRDSATGFGRYHFRLTWDAPGGSPQPRPSDTDSPPAPAGFAWNNAISYHGHGTGESRLNQYSQRLGAVSVNIDRGGKIMVSFVPERGRSATGTPRAVVFTGTVMSREGLRWKADMVTEDHRLHGTLTLSVDDQQNVNSITMDATDGQDRLHLTWDRR